MGGAEDHCGPGGVSAGEGQCSAVEESGSGGAREVEGDLHRTKPFRDLGDGVEGNRRRCHR